MKVIVAHSSYATGDLSGENRVVADEVNLLKSAGHEVCLWCPERHPGVMRTLGSAFSATWSTTAIRHFANLTKSFSPDVVHFHNVFPHLSPAVVRATSARLPTVMTLHNYRLLCLPATLRRDGEVCEDCLGRTVLPGVLHRCYRHSWSASAALAVSIELHRSIRSWRLVDRFLPVSGFVRNVHVRAGMSGEQFTVKPNFAFPSKTRKGAGSYYVVIGRLSEEKGVRELVSMWRGPEQLLVVGDGPERKNIERTAGGNIRFVGRVAPGSVTEILCDARALVVPSRCYEGAPRTVLEAYASGVPVIAHRIGALAEMINHDVTGKVIGIDVVEDLRLAVNALNVDDVSQSLGRGAYEAWRKLYAPDVALSALEDIYCDVVDRRRQDGGGNLSGDRRILRASAGGSLPAVKG